MTTKFKMVSLFSGAMGLDLGLEQSGLFQNLACVEIDSASCTTIRTNQEKGRLDRNLKVYEVDIRKLHPVKFLNEIRCVPGEIDLLVGGPPCQTFSTVGRRQTTQDPRGTLLWEFLRWIEVLQPKFFVMENVRGLLSAALNHRAIAERPEKGGPPLSEDEKPGSVIRAFADDLQHLPDCSYHMDCFEVNAVNYGAPQLRERALFVGNRFNAVIDFPEPTHGRETSNTETLFETKTLKPWRTLGDAIGNLVEINPIVMDFSPRKKGFLKQIPAGSNWRSLPTALQKESMGSAWHAKGGRSGWWRRLSFDLPCPTLVTMPNHASTSLCHPTEVRALTVREYACIQEFPPDWEICGTANQQYMQIGNAVPVRLGQVLGNTIGPAMERLAARNWQPYKQKPNAYRIVYVQSHVRTRQWYKNGKTIIWRDGEESSEAAYAPPVTRKKVKKMAQNG